MYVTANGVYANEAGKWGIKLRVWDRRQEYVVGTPESAPLFETNAEAVEASKRAITLARNTGKLPNLSEKF